MARFLQVFAVVLVILVLVLAALPALLRAFDVPSFSIGDRAFWLLSWRNEAEKTGIRFSVVPLIILAVGVGLVDHWLMYGDRS